MLIPLGRLFFAIGDAHRCIGERATARGWYRRGLKPYIEISSIEARVSKLSSEKELLSIFGKERPSPSGVRTDGLAILLPLDSARDLGCLRCTVPAPVPSPCASETGALGSSCHETIPSTAVSLPNSPAAGQNHTWPYLQT